MEACTHFAVLAPEGRVGHLQSVADDDAGHHLLIISGGLFKRRRLIARADDIIRIDYDRKRVLLGHSPAAVTPDHGAAD